MRRTLTALPLLILLAACQPAEGAKTKAPKPAPAAPAPDLLPGTYRIDPEHASVLFRVDHVGMSKWTAQFRKFDASLVLDPKNPEASSVTAEIDVASLDSKTSPALAFDKELTGPDWLDAGAHPKITFKSTKVVRTGGATADVTGDFTLKGVTKPVVLKVTFNDGYKPNAMDGARVGFSATTRFKRSDFGISYGIPAPGSKMGVSDEVEVIIEAEFMQGKPTGETPPQ
ncbi:polyisoprenoid-binding protein [Caulobacter sp. SLTY]|uniref:YceI family protein n=1 Tax=Caulobacter sp. SLTY TaxID=2683262 RepID=UPI0014131D3A|nr:YceI family protein [Caulobacter sp. SLTY]NBB17268.1 polyisoprenoid-binding protein [Caulobacter sp. SLTY]